MAIAEIKWKLVKDTYFFDTTTCYLSEDGNHLFYSGNEKRIEIVIDDLNELVRKGCAMWLKLGEYDFALDKLSKCPTTTWYGIHQMLYSLEPWGVMKESKESERKSIKESVPFTKITWYDDFLSQEMANLIRDKFDVSVSYFSDFDEGVYGIRIKTSDYNPKILNFIKKKVGDVSVLEESKNSARKSIKEEYDPTDDIVNKGNSVSMDYETFIKFTDGLGIRFNTKDAKIVYLSNDIKMEFGDSVLVIPKDDVLDIVVNAHSSMEIKSKFIEKVASVSLDKNNILRADFFTKEGNVLTVWWEL